MFSASTLVFLQSIHKRTIRETKGKADIKQNCTKPQIAFMLVAIKSWQWPTKPITIWSLGLLWPHLFYMFSVLEQQPSNMPSLCTHSFALAVPSEWKILPPDICMAEWVPCLLHSLAQMSPFGLPYILL